MESLGILAFFIYFLTTACIYAILTLGLNIQWGYGGLLNIGIAGFYAVGAYATVYFTQGIGELGRSVGLNLPFPLALLGAMMCAGGVAFFLALPSLQLDKGYLAITLLGFGEIVRLVAVNEQWMTNGSMGMSGIYRPLTNVFHGVAYDGAFLAIVALVSVMAYIAVHRVHRSPWGRTLKAIRDDEAAAMMQGKNAFRFKIQAFVLGAAVMGAAGSLYAHYIGFINPSSFTSELTFMIWIMLIVGGSGNDWGAILGSFAIWGFFIASNFILNFVPADLTARLGGIRLMVIAALFIYMLIKHPQGLIPEKKWVSRIFS